MFEKSFSMEGVSRISVENVNGEIDAKAWDRPYVKVRAVKNARGGGSAEALRLTEVRVVKKGDEIRIETVSPRRRRLFGFLDFGSHNVRVDYELWVPASAETHLETCNGRVEAAGFSNALACDSVNGSIEIREAEGPVKATTVNGSLRLGFLGPLKRTHLETVNGSVEVVFGKGSSIEYDLETINGRIDADRGDRPDRRRKVRPEGSEGLLQRRLGVAPLRDRERLDSTEGELTRSSPFPALSGSPLAPPFRNSLPRCPPPSPSPRRTAFLVLSYVPVSRPRSSAPREDGSRDPVARPQRPHPVRGRRRDRAGRDAARHRRSGADLRVWDPDVLRSGRLCDRRTARGRQGAARASA